MFSHFLVLAALPPTIFAAVIKEYSSSAPTFYYDNFRCENGNPGGVSQGPNWGDTVGEAYLACENGDGGAKKLKDYRSNQIVAFDATLVGNDKATYCGKKVRIFKPDGSEYISPGGDLFVWDGCAACVGGARIDVSAPDWLGMTGLTPADMGVGEAAFKVQVTDEVVVPYGSNPPDALGGLDTYSGGAVAGLTGVAAGEPVCEAAAGGGAGAATAGSGSAGDSTAASVIESGSDTGTIVGSAATDAVGAGSTVVPNASAGAAGGSAASSVPPANNAVSPVSSASQPNEAVTSAGTGSANAVPAVSSAAGAGVGDAEVAPNAAAVSVSTAAGGSRTRPSRPTGRRRPGNKRCDK